MTLNCSLALCLRASFLQRSCLLAAAVLAALGLAAAPEAFARRPMEISNLALHGIWRNSYNSVDVRIDDCGINVCGVVVGATPEALSDARDSGYPDLVGMQLLSDYHADGARRWSGTVFVPDLGHSFSSHIEMIDADHAKIAGCLWRQFICKSQIWRRV